MIDGFLRGWEVLQACEFVLLNDEQRKVDLCAFNLNDLRKLFGDDCC